MQCPPVTGHSTLNYAAKIKKKSDHSVDIWSLSTSAIFDDQYDHMFGSNKQFPERLRGLEEHKKKNRKLPLRGHNLSVRLRFDLPFL